MLVRSIFEIGHTIRKLVELNQSYPVMCHVRGYVLNRVGIPVVKIVDTETIFYH